MSNQRLIQMECTVATFRGCERHPVRWLDPDADYELTRAYWTVELPRDVWRRFWEEDLYQYCAVIDGDRIGALGGVWRYSETAWEVAAISTHPTLRRQGRAQSIVSFLTAYILGAGRTATCTTEHGNLPMQRTAESVGFYVVSPPTEETEL